MYVCFPVKFLITLNVLSYKRSKHSRSLTLHEMVGLAPPSQQVTHCTNTHKTVLLPTGKLSQLCEVLGYFITGHRYIAGHYKQLEYANR